MNNPTTVILAPPALSPLLTDLADACNNGACNMGGIIRSLGKAIDEVQFGHAQVHPALKVILGQLSFLCGESIGPSTEAYDAYNDWRKL